MRFSAAFFKVHVPAYKLKLTEIMRELSIQLELER